MKKKKDKTANNSERNIKDISLSKKKHLNHNNINININIHKKNE